MVNWKTTLGAIVAALATVLKMFGVVDIPSDVQVALVTIGVFIVGLFAKDHNVTGGTKAQTEEARNRIEE